MSLIKVDSEKCSRDGICVEVCPLSLLSLDPEGMPQMRRGAAGYCIGCGHCVAACPNGALDNTKNPISTHTAIPAQFSPDPAQSAVFLRARRSIRRYRDEPVPRDKILKLLDIARFAPSGHNSQGISYLVVEGSENLMSLRKIVVEWMREVMKLSPEMAERFHMPAIIQAHESGEDRILRGAPHIIVAHAPADLSAAPVSTVLSLEYVELYAPALGIGTCWAGYAQICAGQFPAFSQFLKIPARRTITGILMVGYPKYKYHRLPARNPLDVAWFEAGEL
ncbi:MAG: nitroreductase family protein [Syntrophobacteraceae bacterium]|jgi:nitroreductase/NAD-dependent dihydropyrimidine dehydrogenase PreA subunit